MNTTNHHKQNSQAYLACCRVQSHRPGRKQAITLEHDIEAQLKKAVEASGGLCWKLVSPGTTGVPDRICLRNGRAVFVEVKAPGRKPRPIQQHRMNQLRQQGFAVLVVDSTEGIEGVLDALSAA